MLEIYPGRVIRECGPCTVCCDILEIPTLRKPKKTKCENLCSKGCGIYETRPTECRTFQCIWSEGYTGEGQRPDRSGIMAYHIDHPQFGRTLLILEIKKRAFVKRRKQKDRLIKLAESRNVPVIVSDYDGKSFAMIP